MKVTKQLFKASTLEDALNQESNKYDYLFTPTNYLDMIEAPIISDDQLIKDQELPYASSIKTKTKVKVKEVPLARVLQEHIDGLSDRIAGFIALCKSFPDVNEKIKITSGYRPGATTSNGSTSFHATGDAIDIVPVSGNFDDLAQTLFSHQEIIDYLLIHHLGILDETKPEIMARTGATGKHFHIGPDTNALSGIYSLLTEYGYA